MFLYRLWSVEWVRVSSAGIAVGLRKFADAFEYRLLIQGSEARHKRTHAVKYNTTWARQRVPTYVKRFTLRERRPHERYHNVLFHVMT